MFSTCSRGAGRPSGIAPSVSRTGGALESGSATGVDGGGSDGGGGGASGAAGAAPLPSTEAKQDRARKRRRKVWTADRGGVDTAVQSSRPQIQNAGHATATAAAAAAAATAATTPTPTPAVEPMEEDSMMPANDEVSAGEGPAEPGDGGQPAQRQKFGGGAMSESERAGRRGDGGGGEGGEGGSGGSGREWRKLVGGAILSEEEGDYAADSERSTDHESMHLYGGGGRESDEHDASEREVFRRTRGRGSGASVRRGRRLSGVGVGANAHRGGGGGDGGGGIGRGEFRTSSPETCPDADGENTSGGNSAPGGEGPSGGGSPTRAPTLASPKRPRIATGIIGDSGGPRVGALLDEVGDQSGSLAHSEASGSGGGDGSVGEEEEEEGERQSGEAKDEEMQANEGEGGGAGGNGNGGIGAAAPLQWKAKLGRQPIFMSHGLPEEDPDPLPSHSEGGTRRAGSPGRSGVGGLSRPPQDPEDDRDRASSCSSADSPIPSGSIVRPGSRGNGGRGGGGTSAESVGEGTGKQLHTDFATAVEENGPPARSPPPTASKLSSAPPNSPGGAVPWHHTSVYEANNPTEDRHAELSHDALGVKIYCVCDGHGGSRAAQFVCDHLVANVLARVESIASGAMAPTTGGPAPPAPPAQTPAAKRKQDKGGGSGTGGASNGVGDGVSASAGSGGDEEWTGNEAEIRRSLTDAFESCDEQFIAQLDPTKNRGYINAGCCVVLALLIRSKLYVAHVGDCRVVLGTTDAARFSPSVAASLAPTGAGEEAAAASVAGKRGGVVGHGDAGSRGRGRGARGAAGAGAARARRVGSPLRGSAAATVELDAIALSRDHNCDDGEEAALVRARSGDENAIRVSRSDEWKGARAIKRVAGSLAVTRAIGDAYLKKAAFSFSPYKVRFAILLVSVFFFLAGVIVCVLL